MSTNKRQGLIYLRNNKNTEISFHVKRENITTERNFKINEQEMYSNNTKNHQTNFYHNGSDGLSFTCTAVFTKAEKNTFKRLDTWYRSLTPFTIVFGKGLNLQLPLVSKKWIITKLSMKQETDTITEWGLTFRTYNPPKKIKKVKNNLVNRTSKSYRWQHECKKTYKNLTYKKMKNKEGNGCAKLLNKILIEMGYMGKAKKKVNGKTVKYVPNKCTKDTSRAVKKFKKEWNQYKLTPKFKKTKKGKKSVYDDKISYTGFKNIGNYKKLKNKKKKK